MNFARAFAYCVFALLSLQTALFGIDFPRYNIVDGVTVLGAGGLNIAGKSAVHEKDTLPSYVNFSGALNLWYGNLFHLGEGEWALHAQAGLFAGYVPVYIYTDETSKKKSSDVKFPLVGEMRLIHNSGLFAGLGGGYAHTIIKTLDITEAVGGAAVVSAQLGWEISLPYDIQAGFTLRALYFIQQIENVNGTRGLNNQINILPLLQIGYRF